MSTNPFSPLVDAIAEAVLAKIEGAGTGPRLLSLKAAAEYLAMSADGLREANANGKVRSIRVDRHVRFDRHDLDRFIEDHRS